MKPGREKNRASRTSDQKGAGEVRFRGRFDVKIDPKGRVSLPPSLRLSTSLVVTNHRMSGRNALHVYTLKEWERLEFRVNAISALDPAVQAFVRFYISGGQVVELDGQGRLLLPATLRKFAALENDAVLVGLGDKMEVWPTSIWETLFVEMTSGFDQVQAQVSKLLQHAESESKETADSDKERE